MCVTWGAPSLAKASVMDVSYPVVFTDSSIMIPFPRQKSRIWVQETTFEGLVCQRSLSKNRFSTSVYNDRVKFISKVGDNDRSGFYFHDRCNLDHPPNYLFKTGTHQSQCISLGFYLCQHVGISRYNNYMI
jgi:hypothetical protein